MEYFIRITIFLKIFLENSSNEAFHFEIKEFRSIWSSKNFEIGNDYF